MSAGASASGAPATPAPRRPKSPGREAFERFLRDPVPMGALAVLVAITLCCLSAPWFARDVARTDPFQSDVGAMVRVHGHPVAVMQPADNPLQLGVSPIGPTWQLDADALGADNQGRDVLARLLYGGRVSLLIGLASTLVCVVVAGAVGIVAGFYGGWLDAVLSRAMDVMWAVPVYLIAISLSIVTLGQGLRLGPFTIEADNLLLPILIIATVYIPYVARPVRGQVLSLREADFVLAARCLGVPRLRVLRVDILPNVATTLLVLAPLLTALNILAESALSFLSIGVQAPAASWGTIIEDGQGLIYTRPMVAIAPGLAIVVTVVCLNMIGDGLRDALDPRASQRR